MTSLDEFTARALSDWTRITPRELAEQAIEAGLYSEADQEAALLRWATADMRKRLKKRGPDGVPLAGNLRELDEDGTVVHLYKALQFFNDDDYRVVIADHISWAKRELATAHAYEDDRRAKFGGQLQIPQLIYLSAEAPKAA